MHVFLLFFGVSLLSLPHKGIKFPRKYIDFFFFKETDFKKQIFFPHMKIQETYRKVSGGRAKRQTQHKLVSHVASAD